MAGEFKHRHVSIGFRANLNAHALNNSGSTGNVTDLQKIYVDYRSNRGYEYFQVPGISGNSQRHHQTVIFAEYVMNELGPEYLTNYDAVYQNRYPKEFSEILKELKLPQEVLKKLKNDVTKIEAKIIYNLPVPDVYGFLYTDKSVARAGTVMTSFALPVEEVVREYASSISNLVTHNRVRPVKEKSESGESGMMIFHQYYASAPYAFLWNFDVFMVGRLYNDPFRMQVIDNSMKRKRIELQFKAFKEYLLSFPGAKRSRAYPVAEVKDIAILVSDRPIAIVHPYYEDRIENTAKNLKHFKSDRKLFTTNEEFKNILGSDNGAKLEVVDNPLEAFDKAKEYLQGKLGVKERSGGEALCRRLESVFRLQSLGSPTCHRTTTGPPCPCPASPLYSERL